MAEESLQPWLWGISVVCLVAYAWGRGLVALFHRAAAFVMGLLLVTFHVHVSQLMEIHFPLNELVVWIFVVNPVFWLGTVGIWAWGRYGARRPERRTA
ncbi:MAG: hypothetical protein P8J87_16790 [Verrucomicrobiales bacterium]|nr:hypothetical protein [Verrucomicrobiales bacterium]